MAVAMLPANLVARAKQFADEQLAVYAHLISENESLDDALALGVLTSREATLAQPVQRLAMCRDRCLCLELGQALMTKGLHTAAIDVLRTAADAFADDPAGRRATATRTRQRDLPGSAGKFEREVYHNWALAAAYSQHGGTDEARDAPVTTTAAQAVYAIAVARNVWAHVLQRPESGYLRGLRAQPVWASSDVPAARALEAASSEILAECKRLAASAFAGSDSAGRRRSAGGGDGGGGADPRIVKTGGGEWKDLQLFLGCRKDAANCGLCPITAGVIASEASLNECVYGSNWLSRLAPGTHLKPHCGPSNYKLRVHLAVSIPEGCRIRVGGTWHAWREGECLVFDESFEHEVEVPRGCSSERLVLICDLFHPDLDVERWVLPHLDESQREALAAAKAGRHLLRLGSAS